MLRFAVVLLAASGCVVGGIGGAIVGVCTVIGWHLSEANFNYAVRWGVGVGVVGAAVTAVVLLFARRDSLWWRGSLGAVLTAVTSCASIWWDVVSSLG
jgi:hypothetical protein